MEESLRRLGTDRIDLLQFHEVIRMEDPDRVFAAGGAMEAGARRAESGEGPLHRIHWHKSPAIHLKMLATADSHQFRFDAVQDAAERDGRPFRQLRKECVAGAGEKRHRVLGMKPMGDHIILDSKTASPVECLHYAMNLPTSVVITGCDSMKIVDQAVNAALSFRPMTPAEVATLLAKTTQAAQLGKFEHYKTTHTFDGTYQNPQWLG